MTVAYRFGQTEMISLSTDTILGIGEQIATTHFHTFNHGLMLDARFVF